MTKTWIDSPFAANVLGNLDCKKAAISLSSSLSLQKSAFLCFYICQVCVRETNAASCTDISSGEDFNLLHMVWIHCCIQTQSSPQSILTYTFSDEGNWPLISLQSVWDPSKCHSKIFCHINNCLLVSGDSQFNTTNKHPDGGLLLIFRFDI